MPGNRDFLLPRKNRSAAGAFGTFGKETPRPQPGRVTCSHEADEGRNCSTKLLWLRVQMGIVKALQGTTLAELVEFSRHEMPAAPSETGKPLPVVQAG